MSKKRHDKSSRIEYERYLNRLENKLLKGVTNQAELAAAFGKPTRVIARDIAVVRKRWVEHAPTNTEEARVTRIRQLESLAVKSLDSFERSRQNSEETIYAQRPCIGCRGTGSVPGETDDAPDETCPECKGQQFITVETRKVKGQAGDPAFLRMAKEAITEAAKIEGVNGNATLTMKQMRQAAEALPDGTLKTEALELTLEAPIDMLIRAKAIIEEIREGQKAGVVRVTEATNAPSSMDETRRLANEQYVDAEDVSEADDEETEENDPGDEDDTDEQE
jgi:DnaJ-class molecular chaperone